MNAAAPGPRRTAGRGRDAPLSVRIGLELPLRDAAEAHRRLEVRATTGKVLLIP